MLTDYNGSGVFQQWYAYGNYIDEVIMMGTTASPTSARFYIHDHLYSPVALTNFLGNVVERYEYDAYGNPTIWDAGFTTKKDAPGWNPYLFTGRRVDILDSGSLKIQYNRNRYYDYYSGRWLAQAPLGITPNAQWPNKFGIIGQYKDGMNLYEYVGSSPLVGPDAYGMGLGLDCIFCGLALITKFGGAIGAAMYYCPTDNPYISWGECVSGVLKVYISKCELWKEFKGNPSEWIGAAACISCGVNIISDLFGEPGDCPPPECCDDDSPYPIPPPLQDCPPCRGFAPYVHPDGTIEYCTHNGTRTSKAPCVCGYTCKNGTSFTTITPGMPPK